MNQSKKDYYKRNKEKVIARSKEWGIKNRSKLNEIRRKYRHSENGKKYYKKYYEANKEKICARTRLNHQNPIQKIKDKLRSPLKTLKRWEKKFGITLKIYNEMLKNQNYVCAICFNPETTFDSRLKIKRKLSVDHCHKTGKIRGLLCSRCNLSIGRFEDSILLLESAIKYLSKQS